MADTADPWAAFRNVPASAAAGDPWAQFRAGGAVPKEGQSIPAELSPMQETKRAGAGFLHGARDPIAGGAQLLTHGLSDLAPKDSWFDRYMTGQLDLVNRLNQESEKGYQEAWRKGQTGPDVARMAGNVAATAPIAAAMPGAAAASLPVRMLSGMASGGVTAALEPVDPTKGDFWSQKGGQVLPGIGAGAAAPMLSGLAARVISPNTRPEVQMLMNEGVRTTPGQTLGGWANRLEEGMQSIPFVGDVVKGARTRSIESFNRAAIDRALEPIGARLAPNTPMGRQAIEAAHDTVTGAYDALLPQLRVRADPQFANNVTSIVANTTHLEPGLDQTFRTILHDKVFSRFSPSGGMTGNDFKTIESELGRLARNYSTSADAGHREMGGALRQMQAEMRDLLTRSNPQHAGELANINSSYAQLLRVEGAAGRQGAEQGVFTPAQLSSAVRSLDPSMRKGQFARGEALMQDLSDAGKTVLGNKVPDSGTPYRHFLTIPALMGVGGGAGYMAGGDPHSGGMGALAGGALATLPYTRPGAALARAMLAQRPAVAAPIASVVRNNPVTTPLAAILAQQSGGP